MSQRVIVTLHLPLDMGAVVRVLRVVSRDYPDAVISDGRNDGLMRVTADPDVWIGERRKIAKERRAATPSSESGGSGGEAR